MTFISGVAADGDRIALATAGPVHGIALLLLLLVVFVGFAALIVHLVRRWRRQRAWRRLAAAHGGQTLAAP